MIEDPRLFNLVGWVMIKSYYFCGDVTVWCLVPETNWQRLLKCNSERQSSAMQLWCESSLTLIHWLVVDVTMIWRTEQEREERNNEEETQYHINRKYYKSIRSSSKRIMKKSPLKQYNERDVTLTCSSQKVLISTPGVFVWNSSNYFHFVLSTVLFPLWQRFPLFNREKCLHFKQFVLSAFILSCIQNVFN